MIRHSVLLTIFLTLLLLITISSKPLQLTSTKLAKAIHQNQFTLVYFYSTTCQYCQQFTPKFEQLQKINSIQGLVFGKIDGPAFKDVTQKYQIFSYPSIALFWKGVDLPIFYLMERQVDKVLQFIKSNTKPQQNLMTKTKYAKLSEQQKFNMITYFGPPECHQLKVTSVLSIVQPYRVFSIFPANVTQPYLLIKNVSYYNFNQRQMLTVIRTQFAQVYPIQEEPWRKIFQRKQVGIVYANVDGIKGRQQRLRVQQILKKLAIEFPFVVFMSIEPSQQQFKQAIEALGVQFETNIYGVHQRYNAKFLAPKPYSQQSLRTFIEQTLNVTAQLYMRSQKTSHKQKLTLQNFDQKVKNQPKDVVLFLYKTQDRLQAKFMDLFRYLTEKLKDNKNISFLRCNLSKNQIQMKLEFQVKVTPLILFYGHRMKDKPVHYLKSLISAENVIEFIMENTTFDWEDQWGEL